MADPDRILAQMVTQLRDYAHPDRIILFGSRARGDARPDSDFDILVVAPSSLPRWRRSIPLYRLLAGVGVPKELVWWTPEEVQEWQNVRSHFITTALREGKVLYEKPA